MTKHNFSIDDMRDCLENCHGVEEDYLIPATFAADGDPRKFEKVLGYFTGDRFQRFNDPTMVHDCECPIFIELYRPEKFTLEINLGNDEMSNADHLIDALTQLADRIGCGTYGKKSGKIQDRNGGSVGKWELK